MSIKSDKWIQHQCRTQQLYVERTSADEQFMFAHHIQSEGDAEMSRKRGHEVRLATMEEMGGAGRLPMIEPFEKGQVRTRTRPLTETEKFLYFNGKSADINGAVEQDSAGDLQLVEKIISHGTSSYGYDIRCADEFKIFTNIHSTTVDPKNFDEKSFVDVKGPSCVIPPNSFALARSLEYMRIPRDILVVCLGKSTYARCGIIVNVTPLEPEWEGHITLEFSNTTPLPARIYANEGVAQLLFFQADDNDTCLTSYKDRNGKYMHQTGVTLPRG